VLRSGARPGDAVVVCGAIGDGFLGLKAARGEIADAGGYLERRFRLPEPLLQLREAVRAHARACADVSDGLLVDALHLAEASGCRVRVDLGRVPSSEPAQAWLAAQPNAAAARLALATGGDDYALVCAAADGEALAGAARAAGVAAAVVGTFVIGEGIEVSIDGAAVQAGSLGWRHA
jgi:thiamine-monophosphate kinase